MLYLCNHHITELTIVELIKFFFTKNPNTSHFLEAGKGVLVF